MTNEISTNYGRALPLIEEYKVKRDELADFRREMDTRKKKLVELTDTNEQKFNFETHDDIRKLEESLESADQAFKQEKKAFERIENQAKTLTNQASRDYFRHTMTNDKEVAAIKEEITQTMQQGMDLLDRYESKRLENVDKTLNHFEDDLDYSGEGLSPTYFEPINSKIRSLKTELKSYTKKENK